MRSLRPFAAFAVLCAAFLAVVSTVEADESPERSVAAFQIAQAEGEAPDVVATKFIDAGNSGDKATFTSLLTEKARVGFGEDSELNEDQGFDSYTIRETTIEGETAQVIVDAVDDGKDIGLTLRMRLENAAWRVFAMDIDMGDGVVMKMDLEMIGGMLDSMGESMEESAEAMGEEFASSFETSGDEIAAQRAKYDQLRAISTEAYEASWKNTVDFSGKPAKEALTQLAESIGLSVHLGESGEALSANVKSDVSEIAAVEAIERIANDAGLYAVFPDPQYGGGMFDSMATALAEGITEMMEGSGITIEGAERAEPEAEAPANAIRFESGARAYPIAFTGPFAIEITGVQENVPHATGLLYLAIRAYGLDPALLALLEGDSDGTWFEPIVDAQGRALTEEGVTYFGGAVVDGSNYSDTYSMELLNLIREVESIPRVAGVKHVQRPEAIVELVFADASEGASAEAGGFTATIDSAGEYTEISVTVPDGVSADEISAAGAAENSEGEPIEEPYVSWSSWEEGTLDVSVSLMEAPAVVRIKLAAAMEVLEYPFELTGIALEHFAEMPEKIEELAFEGFDQPVTVEFVEFVDSDDGFGEANVRVINHSNKDAESISLQLVYLDKKGEVLDDWPSSLSGEYEFTDGEMVSSSASEKNSTKEMAVTAFGMPDGAKSATIEVTSVDFLDGSRWEPEY